MNIRAATLRALIRNDEALHEHYTRWAQGMRPGDLAPTDLPARVDALLDRLESRRAELASTVAACSQPGAGRPASAVAGLTLPAAPAATTETASTCSLITSAAAQPAS